MTARGWHAVARLRVPGGSEMHRQSLPGHHPLAPLTPPTEPATHGRSTSPPAATKSRAAAPSRSNSARSPRTSGLRRTGSNRPATSRLQAHPAPASAPPAAHRFRAPARSRTPSGSRSPAPAGRCSPPGSSAPARYPARHPLASDTRRLDRTQLRPSFRSSRRFAAPGVATLPPRDVGLDPVRPPVRSRARTPAARRALRAVQLLAELAPAHERRQFLVRREHEPTQERAHLAVPDPPVDAVLHGVQELALDGPVDVAELVEDQRAAPLREPEVARPILRRPREGAAPVAAELRVEKRVGHLAELRSRKGASHAASSTARARRGGHPAAATADRRPSRR